MALNAAPALMRGCLWPGSLTSFLDARISRIASILLAVFASTDEEVNTGSKEKKKSQDDEDDEDDGDSQGFKRNMTVRFFNPFFFWLKGRLVWWEPAARTTDWISS